MLRSLGFLRYKSQTSDADQPGDVVEPSTDEPAPALISPYRRAKPFEARGSLRPHVAAGPGQTEARIAAIQQLIEFRHRHREAKRRWCAGDRDVVFLAGTYWR